MTIPTRSDADKTLYDEVRSEPDNQSDNSP